MYISNAERIQDIYYTDQSLSFHFVTFDWLIFRIIFEHISIILIFHNYISLVILCTCLTLFIFYQYEIMNKYICRKSS